MFRGSGEASCLRCGHTVYPVDRVGPLKDFSFFHSGCFKCVICGSRLSLRTYTHSQNDPDDKEVYCPSHTPKTGPGHLDGSAVGIRSALNVPRTTSVINDQIRGGWRGTYDAEVVHNKPGRRENRNGQLDIRPPSTEDLRPAYGGSRQPSSSSGGGSGQQFGRFDASALHIAHALRATQIQKAYKKEKPLHLYLAKEEQTELEMRHRVEEDALYNRFAQTRAEEEAKITAEIHEEWERELQKLGAKFESLRSREDIQTVQKLRAKEREDLDRHMTLRRDKKKEQTTRKLLEHERAATAALVEKQSREMLDLINERKREFEDLSSGGSHQETIENRESYPPQPPPPAPPTLEKGEIYVDPLEFTHVDGVAISVAQEDQKTFTDLVRKLLSCCGSDVEKARAIFRWITVKNLNAMDFGEELRTDTPLGLLRGIKQGTESYHVLFKRLCSYAGLHCVVIKGLSKSAGYQPGLKFSDNRFRNSWNAVFVAGAWRFVQCNWGARHLVNAKERPSKSDSLRYEYDDHYFLTDPKEFIFEFFSHDPEWQLLRRQLTLREFEELPFVRSLFFRYGLQFPPSHNPMSSGTVMNSQGEVISYCKAVLATDSSGAATIRIEMPPQMEDSLIFHYNLKAYNTEEESHDGVSLKRFVLQSVAPPVVSFRVHAPFPGAFLLDIFANAVTPREYLTGEPMKFKSVCKVKIECQSLSTVMVPLPDCASGEWGPAKALRLFGLVPVTHSDPLIFTGRDLVILFRMSRRLTDFMATLHKNGTDERKLAKFATYVVSEDEVTFTLQFPEEGQYGLDIYTREIESEEVGSRGRGGGTTGGKQLLTHCCKYLINSSKKNN